VRSQVELQPRLEGGGHEAFSCDLLPTSGGHPEWHFQCDVRKLMYADWDLVLAFPPCTHLCVSGARWFKDKEKEQREGMKFFLLFTKLKCRWAIENPIGIMSTHYRKPDQIVQPLQFGHPTRKATCLWLNELQPLKSTNVVQPNLIEYTNKNGKKRTDTEWHWGSGKGKGVERSKTYQGIAEAMAAQWG